MIVIHNRWLPIGKHFVAINLFGVILAKARLNPCLRNHEFIHTLQQRELLFVGFYVWYVLEWLFRLCQTRNARQAYHRIRFEREAYKHQNDLSYAQKRKLYNWLREE